MEGRWAAGAVVSVILDTGKKQAYIQNPASINISDEVTTMYGLSENASLNEVLSFMGKYNLHWWKRRTRSVSVTIGDETEVHAVSRTSNTGTSNISYYDGYELDAVKEKIVFSGTRYSTSAGYSSPNGAKDIVGYYFTPSGLAGVYYCTSYVGTIRDSDAGYYYVDVLAKEIRAVVTCGEWEYLYSADRNAYPEGITDYNNGYEYAYLGIPFDNAVNGIRTKKGKYVGTGELTTSIDLGCEPDFVIVSTQRDAHGGWDYHLNTMLVHQGGYKGYGNTSSNNAGSVLLSGSTLTLTCDSTGYAARAMNDSDTVYKWFAFILG